MTIVTPWELLCLGYRRESDLQNRKIINIATAEK